MSTRLGPDNGIAERLRALQVENGWSLQQMADVIGISRSSLQNHVRETKSQRPGVQALAQMARGLRVSSDWLLGLTSSRDPYAEQGDRLSLTELSAKLVIEQFIASANTVHKMKQPGNGDLPFYNGMLFGVDPEVLSADYAYRVMNLYSKLQTGRVDRAKVAIASGADEDNGDRLMLDPPPLDLDRRKWTVRRAQNRVRSWDL